MKLPENYIEQVYAGVLGKIIGVYLGRPFEGWPYDKIMSELGEVNYFVHEKYHLPLVVTDDDIAGTFTFIRALSDYEEKKKITSSDIAQTWLNYIIEDRTILWWGGFGHSTEHTAYLRMKNGIPAPLSGSVELNGKTIAEQIGAQIFIDGWAMVCPGDPERAVELARLASSVSHDGEAIYGAQVIAAMEAQAFIEKDLYKLIDTALSFIPANSIVYRLVNEMLEWRSAEPDWRETLKKISSNFGPSIYPGHCHIIPNHALVLLGLLYGDDQFQKSLMITNTAGWDTDCNSGNVGCVLGIKNGLAGIDAGPDWRGPVADRLYISAADGGRAISDAVTETYNIVNIGRALVGDYPLTPKNGARFHFELPGALQGFMSDDDYESRNILRIENVIGNSEKGNHSLALHFSQLAPGRFGRAKTPTFIPLEAKNLDSYELIASPTLYPGQVVKARVSAAMNNDNPVFARLYINVYDETDQFQTIYGTQQCFLPGENACFEWQIGDTGGNPIAEIGIEIISDVSSNGVLYLDYLTWGGVPDIQFRRPKGSGKMWRRAWVNAVDLWDPEWPETYRLVQNNGRGLLIQGCRDWDNYAFKSDITPHLFESGGIAVHVQGLQRYYALLFQKDGKIQLIKMLDGEHVLAEIEYDWCFDQTYQFGLNADGAHLQAYINGQMIFDIVDTVTPFLGGAIALICQSGCLTAEQVEIHPMLEGEK
ncbi:MAG: ADP-ribosylglycohydrolase family protein [Anaerolineaceae bacterium]|nr:ADP-ribosylglycohydrolase family protein [Anaerolineaceae bacterium]